MLVVTIGCCTDIARRSNRSPQKLSILSPPFVDAVAASLVAPPSIFDANDDGVESALDALAIINYLNRIGFEVDPERYPESVLLDLDHSGKVEPQDALRIINRQNRQSAEGENHDRALEELLNTDLTGVALLRF